MNQHITFRFSKQLLPQATSSSLPVEHLEITRVVDRYLTREEADQLVTGVKREAEEKLGRCNYNGYQISRV